MSSGEPLRHPLLEDLGVDHGFGVRGFAEPADLRRPRQVHGARVATAAECASDPPPEADAVVSTEPALRIAIVTADCIPVLLAGEGGRVVAAIHAGWRGLAAGVIGAGVAGSRAGRSGALVAVIGPHIGPCCYEVDEPVITALGERFESALGEATRPTRPGHVALDLGHLARGALVAAGIAGDAIGAIDNSCTACIRELFHSYRRDGSAAGRLVHYIAARQSGEVRAPRG